MEFPETIFVTLDPNSEGEGESVLVWRQEGDGVGNDGPTRVASYRLIETRLLKWAVEETKEASTQ